MSGQIPNSFLMPMNKNVLQNMKYDGNAMSRHKKIKKFLPLLYDAIIISAFQSKSKYTYTGKEFFSDIFTMNDAKIKTDLVQIIQYMFPMCAVYYSENKDIGGNIVHQTITVDWS